MRFDVSLLSLRLFTEVELVSTHAWLNEPELQDITMTSPFTKEQQLAWFKGLPNRNDFLAKALHAQYKLIGA